MLSQASQELEGALRALEKANPSALQANLLRLQRFGVENSFKVYHGHFQALSQPGFIDAKRAQDEAIRAKVEADPAISRRFGDPWAEIAAIQADRAALNARYTLLETRAGYGSELFGSRPRSFAPLWLRLDQRQTTLTRPVKRFSSYRKEPTLMFGKTNPTPNVFGCMIHGRNARGGTRLFTTEARAAVRPLAEEAVLRSKPGRMAAATRFVWELEGGTLYRPDWPTVGLITLSVEAGPFCACARGARSPTQTAAAAAAAAAQVAV